MADDVTTAIDPGTEDPASGPAAAAAAGSPETLPREAEPPAADPAKIKTESPPTDWRDAIEDEEQRKFADRFTTAADMAKAGIDFRKQLSSAVVVPGENATEEDVAAFHKALGVPVTPAGYRVKLDEELLGGEEGSERLEAFAAAMHKSHATPAAVKAAVEWYAETVKVTMKAEEGALKKAVDEHKATLRKEWGDDADANATHATQAAHQFGGEQFRAFFETVKVDGVPLGDHPAFLRPWAEVGRRMGEAIPLIGLTDDQVSSLQEEQSELLAKQAAALDSGNTVEADRLDRRLQEIARKQAGEQPIVGAQGRAV
jgi:hypothetical protein